MPTCKAKIYSEHTNFSALAPPPTLYQHIFSFSRINGSPSGSPNRILEIMDRFPSTGNRRKSSFGRGFFSCDFFSKSALVKKRFANNFFNKSGDTPAEIRVLKRLPAAQSKHRISKIPIVLPAASC